MKGRRGRPGAKPGGEAQPIDAVLRERAEVVRQEELAEALGKLPGLTPAQREELDALSRRLVERLLSRPLARLKRGGKDAAAVRELFGIEKDS